MSSTSQGPGDAEAKKPGVGLADSQRFGRNSPTASSSLSAYANRVLLSPIGTEFAGPTQTQPLSSEDWEG